MKKEVEMLNFDLFCNWTKATWDKVPQELNPSKARAKGYEKATQLSGFLMRKKRGFNPLFDFILNLEQESLQHFYLQALVFSQLQPNLLQIQLETY